MAWSREEQICAVPRHVAGRASRGDRGQEGQARGGARKEETRGTFVSAAFACQLVWADVS